jgi:hypothetical protein
MRVWFEVWIWVTNIKCKDNEPTEQNHFESDTKLKPEHILLVQLMHAHWYDRSNNLHTAVRDHDKMNEASLMITDCVHLRIVNGKKKCSKCLKIVIEWIKHSNNSVYR